MYKIKEKVVIFSRFVHRFKFFIRAYVSYPCTKLVDESVQLLPCTPEIQAHQRESKYLISLLEIVLFKLQFGVFANLQINKFGPLVYQCNCEESVKLCIKSAAIVILL